MKVILDQDTGRVYVRREPTPDGVEPQHTHQYRKYGVTMVWDGHGELLGIEFASDQPEVTTVLTVSSEDMPRQVVTTSA